MFDVVVFRAGADEQADAGDVAVCVVATGLLAARTVSTDSSALHAPRDRISFAVMKERGIKGALTGDHHFEQAGFKALLK